MENQATTSLPENWLRSGIPKGPQRSCSTALKGLRLCDWYSILDESFKKQASSLW